MTTAAEAAPSQSAGGGSFEIRDYLFNVGAYLGGPANVIMQLSWPAVGYGVLESKVESGSAVKHPIKRTRTTLTYLAVALLGNDEDRRAYRKAVSGQHVQVRSDESSPVEYSAMDPQLQLWVAACLYYGFIDLYERMYGPLEDETADALYRYSARLGTSLQVREDMWPADRAAFTAYWEQGLAQARIDEPVRAYLDSLARLRNLPRLVQWTLGERNLFWTRGFLPPRIRELMGYQWSDADEARFNQRLRRIGRTQRWLPEPVRVFPFNLLLWDMRRRVRHGIPLV
jgi:uncharacterized protein (DUF2236 family)